MDFHCLKKSSFADPSGYALVPIREEDMEMIRLFRNAQIDCLRQKRPLSQEEQTTYFTSVIYPLFSEKFPSQILFSFLFQESFIGYGGLTLLDWEAKRAELSFLVDPKIAEDRKTYQKVMKAFLNLLLPITFQELSFHRLIAETYAFRESTRSVLEEIGFHKEGVLRDHVYKKGQWFDSVIYALLDSDWKIKD